MSIRVSCRCTYTHAYCFILASILLGMKPKPGPSRAHARSLARLPNMFIPSAAHIKLFSHSHLRGSDTQILRPIIRSAPARRDNHSRLATRNLTPPLARS